MKKGIFITLEGPDGCGKTTQSRLLAETLRKKGFKVIHTREPGGTSFSEKLRKIILSDVRPIYPLTELLLYEASRAQHTEEMIRPALKKNKVVICERYGDATCAYQGYGRGLNLRMIRFLNAVATDRLLPDLTILLDIPASGGLKRTRIGRSQDRLEKEGLLFHNRVRRGYFSLAKKAPRRIKIISGEGTVEEVQRKVWEKIRWKLKDA